MQRKGPQYYYQPLLGNGKKFRIECLSVRTNERGKKTQEKREYDQWPQAPKLKSVIDRCVFYSLDPLALSCTVWQHVKET